MANVRNRAGRVLWTVLTSVLLAASAAHIVWARTSGQNSVHVQGTAWQVSPLATELVPLSDLTLTAGVVTDVNGNATLPAGYQLLVPLRGPYADVVPPNSAQRLLPMLVTTGGDDVLDFGGVTDAEIAQITAFAWTNRVNRWARAIVPSLNAAPTTLDGMVVRVNVTGLSCTGFFDPAFSRISLGAATATCRNMAVPTIITHEVGHAIQNALSPGTGEGAFIEGLADAVSALVTDDPCFGRESRIAGPTCIRDATEVTLYPDPSPDFHLQGKPYAQFAWALRQQLGTDLASQLVLGAVAAGAADIPAAVHSAFVLDDDDGDLGTCSAHQRVLEATADSRALPRPSDCSDFVPPTGSVSDAEVFEGKTGQSAYLEFEVALTGPAAAPVTVSYSTQDGSASAASDYRAQTGSVQFATGEKSKTIRVLVRGDGLVERDETLAFRITAQGATLTRSVAQGRVKNDDNVGVATLTPAAAIVEPQDVVPFEFGWVVPSAKPDGTPTNNHWRDLRTMTLRLASANGDVAFEILWVQETNTFQVRSGTGKFGKPFLPGSNTAAQQTETMSINPSDVVVRTAPGPAMSILLPIKMKPAAALQLFIVSGAATDDFGDEQPFENLGLVLVRRR